MIKITISRLKDNRIGSFTVSGHAYYDEPGKDIVCAGVSAVTVGTVNAIDQLCGISASKHTEMKHGYLQYSVPTVNEETDYKAQLLLEGMLVSLRSIQEGYEKFIHIREKLQEV
ncbi:MAG: ribosomal-processing cysteine protease Prp [Bacillaceae bacterium]